jgi:VanZ family protein
MATRPQEPRPRPWSAATAPQVTSPDRVPGAWRSRFVTVWLPVVAWAALIFTLSSVPSLGTGLGTWDTILRKCAHVTEYAVLAFLLRRALSTPWAFVAAVAYAASDEVHQTFVRGRHGAPRDVLIDSIGIVIGLLVARRVR